MKVLFASAAHTPDFAANLERLGYEYDGRNGKIEAGKVVVHLPRPTQRPFREAVMSENNPSTKWCPKCNGLKPVSEFFRNSRSKDRRFYCCKTCAYTYRHRLRKLYRTSYKPPSPEDTKRCTKCNQVKPVGCFNRYINCKSGLKESCKECAEVARKLRRYGITGDQFQKLWREQNYKCAICRRTIKLERRGLHVDHCHSTGKIRGLLCFKCNVGVGAFRDDPLLLEMAIAYLHAHGAGQEAV